MMKRKWERYKGINIFSVKLFLFLLEIFILCFIFLDLPKVRIGEVSADQSTDDFKDEVRATIKKLSVSLIGPVSINDINAIEMAVKEIFLEADEKGRPIRFGIGILDRNGIAVAEGYIIGAFKGKDFSKYEFVRKAFKKKKIIQNRLYFQDRSELLIICAPLVHQKRVVGALVLGFNPAEVKKDYGLDTRQFLALDFNK
jgi:hypothetical protein